MSDWEEINSVQLAATPNPVKLHALDIDGKSIIPCADSYQLALQIYEESGGGIMWGGRCGSIPGVTLIKLWQLWWATCAEERTVVCGSPVECEGLMAVTPAPHIPSPDPPFPLYPGADNQALV